MPSNLESLDLDEARLFRERRVELGLFTLMLLVSGGFFAVLAIAQSPPDALPSASFRETAPRPKERDMSLYFGLREDVRRLVAFGPRDAGSHRLDLAREFLVGRLEEAGLEPRLQTYDVHGRPASNVLVDVGRPAGRQLLVGAHYDSVPRSPGANDNASGVAVTLALVERFAADPPEQWVRFVFFTHEEPPHFRHNTMGSRAFARWAADRGELPDEAVILDSVGHYIDAPQTQNGSARVLAAVGDRGNFIAFVSNHSSLSTLERIGGAFRAHGQLRARGGALSEDEPGVSWSDHASFWQHGVPAILVTDTAGFRDDAYHRPDDDGGQIDYDALTQLVRGLDVALRTPRSD